MVDGFRKARDSPSAGWFIMENPKQTWMILGHTPSIITKLGVPIDPIEMIFRGYAGTLIFGIPSSDYSTMKQKSCIVST